MYRTIAMSEVESLFAGVTLDDYLLSRPPRGVFSLSPTASLAHTLKQLCLRGILSAPILNESGTYFGFVDTMDIASAFFERFTGPPSASQLRELEDFMDHTEIQSISRANDAQMVLRTHGSLPLLDVVRLGFITPPMKLWCHRLAIFDSENPLDESQRVQIIAIISQSDVVRFIQCHSPALPTLCAATLAQLGFRKSPVFSVDYDVTAADAFQAMIASGSTSCAVLQDGSLVATLSPSDLRGLSPSNWHVLHVPVLDFLKATRCQGGAAAIGSLAATFGVKSHNAEHDFRPAVCSLETRFVDALDIFVSRSPTIHRVYLVETLETEDVGAAPVGLITLTDILSVLFS